MDATPHWKRERQSMQVEKDESEFLHDTHPRRRHLITDMHTGHRFAGERARHHADQDQSTAVHHASSAHMLCWPVKSWTSDVIASDRSTISKIRARHDMRNHLLYTAHAVGSRGSRRCGQQVCRQKPYHTTRVGPVGPNSRKIALIPEPVAEIR